MLQQHLLGPILETNENIYFLVGSVVVQRLLRQKWLTPKLVPAVMLAEVSIFNTTGNLSAPRTSPTIPPTNPMIKPDARIIGIIRSISLCRNVCYFDY